MDRNLQNGGITIQYKTLQAPKALLLSDTLPASIGHSWPVFGIQGAEPIPAPYDGHLYARGSIGRV